MKTFFEGIAATCQWIALFVGAMLGWGCAEFSWRFNHPHGLNWQPARGFDYCVIAILCALAGAALGIALVCWRDLPPD